MTINWIFRPIDASFDRENFDCGKDALNTYLKRFARQNHERGISRIFVALREDEDVMISGFYSLCMAQVSFQSFPAAEKRLPRYPIPALRISQLAVDPIDSKNWARKGFANEGFEYGNSTFGGGWDLCGDCGCD